MSYRTPHAQESQRSKDQEVVGVSYFDTLHRSHCQFLASELFHPAFSASWQPYSVEGVCPSILWWSPHLWPFFNLHVALLCGLHEAMLQCAIEYASFSSQQLAAEPPLPS